MITMALNKDISDIKVSLGEIKQHLSDMNGKIAWHDEFINKEYPAKNSCLTRKITSNNNKLNVIIGGVIVLNALIVIFVNVYL